jgi:hypothetical protein
MGKVTIGKVTIAKTTIFIHTMQISVHASTTHYLFLVHDPLALHVMLDTAKRQL